MEQRQNYGIVAGPLQSGVTTVIKLMSQFGVKTLNFEQVTELVSKRIEEMEEKPEEISAELMGQEMRALMEGDQGSLYVFDDFKSHGNKIQYFVEMLGRPKFIL